MYSGQWPQTWWRMEFLSFGPWPTLHLYGLQSVLFNVPFVWAPAHAPGCQALLPQLQIKVTGIYALLFRSFSLFQSLQRTGMTSRLHRDCHVTLTCCPTSPFNKYNASIRSLVVLTCVNIMAGPGRGRAFWRAAWESRLSAADRFLLQALRDEGGSPSTGQGRGCPSVGRKGRAYWPATCFWNVPWKPFMALAGWFQCAGCQKGQSQTFQIHTFLQIILMNFIPDTKHKIF